MQAAQVLAILCLSLLGAPGDVLLREDFEAGTPQGWTMSPGRWSIVEDPADSANHVLCLSGVGEAFVGDPEWDHVRLSARLRIETTAPVYHVKLGCRAESGNRRYLLNLRNDGPIVVFQDGQVFTPLGQVGDLAFRPGQWVRAEFEAAGPVLTARAWREDTPDARVQARFYEPSLTRGRALVSVWLPEGEARVLLDDLEVVEIAAPEASAEARVHTIASDEVELRFDESSARFTLVDRRTGRQWPQVSRPALMDVSDLRKTPSGLGFALASPAGPVRVSLELQGAEVMVTLEPVGKGYRANLDYPLTPKPPNSSAELVLPIDEGMLVPVTTEEYRRLAGTYQHQQGGWLMPWCGLVIGEEGLMTLVETADDFQGRVERVRTPEGEMLSAAVSWLPSLDDLRYPRRLRYCLFDRGGYVAMAKRYRRHLVEEGRFRTLGEKAEELPQVARLLGAINILDQAGGQQVLDWMIAGGIRRALYSCGGPRERIEKAKAVGYVVNRYDIYTDVAGPELLEYWGPARNDKDHRRIGFPQECYTLRDGSPLPGFAYPIGARQGVDPGGREGKRVRCYKRCSVPQLGWMKAVIPEQIAELGYNARFIDVETAHPLYECYSPEHPLTRTQDREARVQLFDYLRSLGQVCSSEGGADWPAHALHYQEGSLTLNRLGGIPGAYVGTAPFDLPEDYDRSQFDMAIRVPLHKLVYHDSVLMTWRWNHTPNRWNQPERWDDWDLIHLLYGGMPIFVVNEQSIAGKGARILQTYHTVCDFTETVAGHEMVSHRFLTPDRAVQETRFANGRGVVVNFSPDKPFESEHGTVKPKGFLVLGG